MNNTQLHTSNEGSADADPSDSKNQTVNAAHPEPPKIGQVRSLSPKSSPPQKAVPPPSSAIERVGGRMMAASVYALPLGLLILAVAIERRGKEQLGSADLAYIARHPGPIQPGALEMNIAIAYFVICIVIFLLGRRFADKWRSDAWSITVGILLNFAIFAAAVSLVY